MANECNDPKCAIHGEVKARGAEFVGRVVSDKAKKTAIVVRDYTLYSYKYERYLRKRSRILAHNPDCLSAKEGDSVRIAESRKLSKKKAFVITEVVKRAS